MVVNKIINQLQSRFLNLSPYSPKVNKDKGFTMVELIVGMFIATLVITPMLAMANNMLRTDRREQARSTAEDELQIALEYISRDLQQSVYIYDQTGVDAISAQLPQSTANTTITPVLVFWKRKLIEDSVPVNRTVNSNQCSGNSPNEDLCNDGFVYALVGYFLIEGGSDIWSDTARIGRFEIQDGVTRTDNNQPVDEDDSRVGIDDGFKIFEIGGGETIAESMNAWQRDGEYSTGSLPQSNILIDYAYQSTVGEDPDAPPSEDCPVDSDTSDTDPEWALVPANNQSPGFYVCVFSSQNTARVFLRGNALARVRKNSVPTYKDSGRAFFPTATIEVQGTGLLRN